MTRKEFLKLSAILGINLPLVSSLSSAKTSDYHNKKKTAFSGSVLILGAGAAGLSAAYLLHQQGIDVQVLEASTVYGGRMKRSIEFADFPIPLGAEWLHTKRSILTKIVNNKSRTVETITKPYNTDLDFALVDGKKASLKELGFSIDQKFINATWFDFYEDYIVPSIIDNIQFDSRVYGVDYSGNEVKVLTEHRTYTADKVIVTIPVKLLQNEAIHFTPALPTEKAKAINEVHVWDGCKAFIEFSEKFYPAAIGFNSIPIHQGHKLFFDASYGQHTQKNILGVFAVGAVSKPYINKKGIELKDHLLRELDEVYDGKPSKTYIKHIFQNWTADPYAGGAYVHYLEKQKNIRALGKSIEDKLYFAGDAYTDGKEWSSVHAAANAARRAVKEIFS